MHVEPGDVAGLALESEAGRGWRGDDLTEVQL
jgi:hypothetical protein